MSKKQWLIILGILVIAVSYFGLPSNIDTVLYVILGLIIFTISFSLDSNTDLDKLEKTSLPFIEHRSDTNQQNLSEGNINNGNIIPAKQ